MNLETSVINILKGAGDLFMELANEAMQVENLSDWKKQGTGEAYGALIISLLVKAVVIIYFTWATEGCFGKTSAYCTIKEAIKGNS